MKLIFATMALFAASTGNLGATGIVACYDKVANGVEVARANTSLCATQSNFSVLPTTDFVDWGLPASIVGNNPYGLGSATGITAVFYSPAAHSYADWDARSVGGIVAGVNIANGYTGTYDYITRLDQGNVSDGFVAQIFTGHFNAQPNAGAGSPYGDHLVGFKDGQGPMQINFSASIVSVGFYISSLTNPLFNGTIKAYDHINPLSTDTPVLAYRVTNNLGGTDANCVAEATSTGPPCNDAPFIGVDGNNVGLLGAPTTFRSIVISTDDNTGFFIDSMYLGNVLSEIGPGPDTGTPEPGSALLIGGGMVLVAMASRRFRPRR